jgi:hypothetical protein
MKKISFVVLLLSTLLLSCTKQVDTSAISTSVSNNAAEHANYDIAYQVDGVGYYDCPGIKKAFILAKHTHSKFIRLEAL